MNARLRVLRIIARLNVGGPARHVIWLTEALDDDEFETLLVSGTVPPGEDDMSGFAEAHGVRPLIVQEMSREISPRDIVTVWKAFNLMRRYRPDIVHTHTSKAGFIGRFAGLFYRLTSRRRRPRFVHTFHGHVFHGYFGGAKTALFLAIERFLAWINTDRILVLSEQQRSEIHGTYRVGNAAQFRVVPLGLDLEGVRHGDRERLRRTLGIAAGEIAIGIVGRLTAIKNHAMFLRAAAELPRGAARFVIFGDGAERNALVQLASTLGLGNRVVFAGTRDAADIYAASDVIALTSNNEGTPLTLIEAMANGLPVVSTRAGGVVDLAGPVADPSADGYAVCARAVTVPINDVAAFARALRRVIADIPLRERLGNAGRTYVEAAYAKDRLVADIIALYRELAALPAANQQETPT